MSEVEEFHFYAFSFFGENRVTGERNAYGSCYMGYSQQAPITRSMIDEAKYNGKMESNSVLLSVSYLGRMTAEQFEEGES